MRNGLLTRQLRLLRLDVWHGSWTAIPKRPQIHPSQLASAQQIRVGRLRARTAVVPRTAGGRGIPNQPWWMRGRPRSRQLTAPQRYWSTGLHSHEKGTHSMFSTIVRDVFAIVGVVATLAGVWIGIIAYRAAKRGERRILREIKKKTRPRYVIGQVAGWVALRPRLGGSSRPQQIDEQPVHPAVSSPRQPKWPWRRPPPEVPSEVPWRPSPPEVPSEVPWGPSPPEVDLPSDQTRPGPVEPIVTRPAPSEHFITRHTGSGFHLE